MLASIGTSLHPCHLGEKRVASAAKFTAPAPSKDVHLPQRSCVTAAVAQKARPAGNAGARSKPKPAPQLTGPTASTASLTKEAHKIFDEAVIVVKSGDGGQGEIVESGKGRWVNNLKYKAGGNQPKQIWLPTSDPADGADGADVVLVCDPKVDSLLHLHTRKNYTAPKGANGNPAVGSGGPKKNKDLRKASTPPLEIPVPPGTVVKRKGTGALLGELLRPGDKLVVAYGGRGGTGVVAPSRAAKQARRTAQERRAMNAGAEVIEVADDNWRADAQGAAGQQLTLSLLLRVVADVGIVGFPNAGKSSLLKALTRAAPDIAPYPFTTLMPNLGVLESGGARSPVLADLPGLIEGAHEGKGLGRMFLRHLRRTRALMHVVDASAEDPATDYYAVREELRMYNPEYCTRPHVVVLNKMDLPAASSRQAEIISGVLAQAEEHFLRWSKEENVPVAPVAVVAVSAATGDGIAQLNKALEAALKPEAFKDVQQRGAAATLVLLPGAAAAEGAALKQQPRHMQSTGGAHIVLHPPSEEQQQAADSAATNGQVNRNWEQMSDEEVQQKWGSWPLQQQQGTGSSSRISSRGGSGARADLSQQGQGSASSQGSGSSSWDEGWGPDNEVSEYDSGGGSEKQDDSQQGGVVDPDDEWLFTLTDAQLMKLLERDEQRWDANLAAMQAQGINPFPDLPEEEAARAAGQAFIQHQQQGSSSEQEEGSDYEGSPGPASAGGDVGDEEGEEEDEWVELSQEELDLLKWLDEHEAEAAEAEEQLLRQQEEEREQMQARKGKGSEANDESSSGWGGEPDSGGLSPEEAALFALSDDQLEALVAASEERAAAEGWVIDEDRQ